MLDKCTREQGDLIILIIWRAWSLHNNATHNSGSTSISESVFFLLNYRDTLLQFVDSSFVNATGEASVRVVIRNHKGEVLLIAWRVLHRCASADEAEGHACVDGLSLASQWCPGLTILEFDLARLIKKVKRDYNGVAHELAHLARQNVHSATWLRQAPACVVDLLKHDCNPCTG
ncbi:hypothetical protein BDA96_06G065800 [Sorghum bicolor]|uniref:RNase H type-1 domain-containing protein n=2 Tax=Sorghum bicolor TaxID=4558 RepID=A0A921QR24_SORBI|nr:hypothetical protein BDA96_06G065800 [Sorghum bicolor]OQU81442.1 hypothetical protein SORBI_3006G059150 [Sorghum bicolor]